MVSVSPAIVARQFMLVLVAVMRAHAFPEPLCQPLRPILISQKRCRVRRIYQILFGALVKGNFLISTKYVVLVVHVQAPPKRIK